MTISKIFVWSAIAIGMITVVVITFLETYTEFCVGCNKRFWRKNVDRFLLCKSCTQDAKHNAYKLVCIQIEEHDYV